MTKEIRMTKREPEPEREKGGECQNSTESRSTDWGWLCMGLYGFVWDNVNEMTKTECLRPKEIRTSFDTKGVYGVNFIGIRLVNDVFNENFTQHSTDESVKCETQHNMRIVLYGFVWAITGYYGIFKG